MNRCRRHRRVGYGTCPHCTAEGASIPNAPNVIHGSEAIRQRILFVVEKRSADGCWIWPARVDKGGYGRITINGRVKSAHRVSFEVFRGRIPDGLHVDHLCGVPRCVNPDHLEPVTQIENNRRAAARAKL